MAEKKSKNFYKLTTYLLLLAIIFIVGFYSFNFYSQNKFNEGIIYGQQTTNEYIVQTLDSKGYLPITLGNQTIALVPSQMMKSVKEETILEILSQVQKNGYVTLYTNNTQVTLIPYNPKQ